MNEHARNRESIITHAAEVLRNGGVIAYPTETVWGLGCDPFDESACTRIRQLKGRDSTKSMLLLAANCFQVERITGPVEGIARLLAELFWPGPLTLVLHVQHALPSYLSGPTGGTAFRVSSDPVASGIARDFGCPIISTSANRSGEPPLIRYQDTLATFGTVVDLVVPSSGSLSGLPSTVVDLTGNEPVILREGVISRTMLDKVWR